MHIHALFSLSSNAHCFHHCFPSIPTYVTSLVSERWQLLCSGKEAAPATFSAKLGRGMRWRCHRFSVSTIVFKAFFVKIVSIYVSIRIMRELSFAVVLTYLH